MGRRKLKWIGWLRKGAVPPGAVVKEVGRTMVKVISADGRLTMQSPMPSAEIVTRPMRERKHRLLEKWRGRK